MPFTFRIDQPYDEFVSLMLGSNELARGRAFTVESQSGSTLIRLQASFMNTLSIGTHTLSATFEDDVEEYAIIRIAAPGTTGPGGTGSGSTSPDLGSGGSGGFGTGGSGGFTGNTNLNPPTGAGWVMAKSEVKNSR